MACAGLAAAGGTLNGPVSAIVYDNATRSVRPALGVPGSAWVAEALADGIDAAAFAPDGSVGLFAKDGGLHLMRRSADGAWTSNRVADGASAAALIVWSGDSSIAAVVENGAAALWRADGSVAARIAGIPGPVTAAAVAGDSLIAAVAAEGIYLLTGGSEAKLLARADNPVCVAVAANDVYFADRGRNEVWALRDYRQGGEPRLVANIEQPVGVAVANDVIVIAGASARKVIALRAGSGEPSFELPLDFEPTGVERFGSAGWLLNAGQPGPLQVLASGPEPAVYFIPRGQERNERAQ
jgi:hypothetical protein